MKPISIKKLERAMENVTPEYQVKLRTLFNLKWENYHRETEYYRTLWSNGKLTKANFEQIAKPKRRVLMLELFQTAKLFAL